MTASALAPTILMFVAIVLVGVALRALKVLNSSDARPINAIIIYVALPAFIFRAVHGATLRSDLWAVVAVAWVVFAVVLAIAWLAARLLRLPKVVAGGFIIAAALGNTGYIGYPITQSLLGQQRLPEAIFYDVFGTVGALVLVGLLVAQHFGVNEESRVNPLRELLTFPAVIALLVALLLRSVAIPAPVSSGLDLLANMVAPLVLLSVGLSLRVTSIGKALVPLALIAGLKLLLAPAVALAVGTPLLGGAAALRVAVLEAGMPSMMLTLVVGERFGLDTDFIAAAILVTTVLCAVTLPLTQAWAFH